MKTETIKNLKQFLFLVLFLTSFITVKAQNEPAWMIEGWRTEQYPTNVYITGFAQDGKKHPGKN